MRINNLLLCYIDYGAKDINIIIYKHIILYIPLLWILW